MVSRKAATVEEYLAESCVRFRWLDDLPLEVIAELVATTPPDRCITRYEPSRRGAR